MLPMFRPLLVIFAVLYGSLTNAQITWPPEDSGGWVLASR